MAFSPHHDYFQSVFFLWDIIHYDRKIGETGSSDLKMVQICKLRCVFGPEIMLLSVDRVLITVVIVVNKLVTGHMCSKLFVILIIVLLTVCHCYCFINCLSLLLAKFNSYVSDFFVCVIAVHFVDNKK